MVNSFTDRDLPPGYAPFNVAVIDGNLYVSFAKRNPTGPGDDPGLGHGFVDKFDLQGNLLDRVASRGTLDSPWGMAIAPDSFGKLAGDLLVGNFGDGTINVFDQKTDRFLGKLRGEDGRPLQNDKLWTITPGNYIGSSSMASSYGAAGSLIVVLLWIYYPAQIFLLGAEFTKVYAARRGSHQQRKRTLLEAK
jgi:uncharacterized protein (TIGR03118 family)